MRKYRMKTFEFGELVELRKEKYNPLTNDTVPCIELEHINQNSGTINGYVNSIEQKSIKNVFHKGDILFAKLRPYLRKYWFAEFDGVCSSEIWVLKPKSVVTAEYLFCLIQTEEFIRIANVSFGSKMPRADWDFINHYPFTIIHSLSEQQRIVSVLSLWDTAIAKQTALIENLTLRKRGLMQQLLTGKKRLKGFEGEWKEVRLGEIGKFAGGCVFNEHEQGGIEGVPFYKVSDMNLEGNEIQMTVANNYVTQEQITRLGYTVIDKESIIFAKVGAAIALERKRYAKNFIIDNNMLAFIPNCNPWFMKHWFDSIILSKYIQVGALPSYNASDLAIIKLRLPSPSEQDAITKVLLGADKEIEIQKQKLAAMQEQKKGLMQVLLTGKRRVLYVPQDVTQGGTQGGTQDGTQDGTQGENLDLWIEEQIKKNPNITTEELSKASGKGINTIKRHISKLSHIKYVGSGYSGHWEIDNSK